MRSPRASRPRLLNGASLAALAAAGAASSAGCSRSDPPTARENSPAAATQPIAPSPSPVAAASPDEAAVRAGEIRLDGYVRSVDLRRGRAVLEAATFSLPNGRTGRLPRPRHKTFAVSEGTVLLRASQRQKLGLGLRPGAVVGVVGTDTGTGRVLPARLVQVMADAPPPGMSALSSRAGESRTAGSGASRESESERPRPRSRRGRAARRDGISRLASAIRAARSTGELDGLDFEIERLKQTYMEQWAQEAGMDGSRALQGVNNFYSKMIAACESLKGATMTKRNVLGGFRDRAGAEEAYYEAALENRRDALSGLP